MVEYESDESSADILGTAFDESEEIRKQPTTSRGAELEALGLTGFRIIRTRRKVVEDVSLEQPDLPGRDKPLPSSVIQKVVQDVYRHAPTDPTIGVPGRAKPDPNSVLAYMASQSPLDGQRGGLSYRRQ
jgi:hypothetical protein